MSARSVTIRRPDDWHVHLRDGAVLADTVRHTAQHFGRAIVMPNLLPPVTKAAMAVAYRERILAALPSGSDFQPLMTCYLTDDSDPMEVIGGFVDGIWVAAKLYPAHATTNSQHGVTSLRRIGRVLEVMERAGMPLLVHAEVTGPDVDIFDREEVFIDRVLEPLLRERRRLRVVIEHVTTEEGVDLVRRYAPRVAATITPHHLVLNRNALFEGGLRPHHYCLPVVKRERHRKALRAAAASGEYCFFLGTDSAPHAIATKESDCGCAGIFNAPTALQIYAQVFAEEDALDNLQAFASLNGPRFYGVAPSEQRITLSESPSRVVDRVALGEGRVVVFGAEKPLAWSIAPAA